MSEFARRLLRWYRHNGRQGLPWLESRDPYRVWLSEIMLQQTQVGTVIPYYSRFLDRFPDLRMLAEASQTEVLSLWSGLGYYARARNLHRCAQKIWFGLDGTFPTDPGALAALPGIGRSTANAIAAFCFDAHVPILDGNVKRVLSRVFGIDGFSGQAGVEGRLWQVAWEQLPKRNLPAYLQAQMDFGATHCTRSRPRCDACPMRGICRAAQEDRVAELPTPRPKRRLPLRKVTLLILRDENRVMLEERPTSGIWGGLFSLPELPDETDLTSHLSQQFGCRAKAYLALPSFVHTFTHFQLEISPVLANASLHGHGSTRASDQSWVALDNLDQMPLPTPVRRILQRVRQTAVPYASSSDE